MTEVSIQDPMSAPVDRGPTAPTSGELNYWEKLFLVPYQRMSPVSRAIVLILLVWSVVDPFDVIALLALLCFWVTQAPRRVDRSKPHIGSGLPLEKKIARLVIGVSAVPFLIYVALLLEQTSYGSGPVEYRNWLLGKAVVGFYVAGFLGVIPGINPRKPRPRTAFGSARILNDIQPLLGEEGLLIGRASAEYAGGHSGRLLSNPDPRHMVTIAANGAGKGVSAIVPNLLAYEGSVLAIDPKGELAAITARRREARGQTVHVLDPFGVSGKPTSSFNPMSLLVPENEDIVEDAAALTDALVYDESGSSDPYWGQEARNLLQGLILHIATSSDFEDQERHLMTLRRLITGDLEDFLATLRRGATNPHCGGSVARLMAPYPDMPEKQFGSVRSSARVSTDFLESARMARVLTATDFDLGTLKRTPTTVYLCLPAARLGTHNRWLRLMIGLALQAMERERGRPERPVVFLLDEFATLGYMKSIENAVGQIRGFGVQLWPVLQDLNQLKSLYRERWETFLGNAGTIQFFGINDQFTAQYVSRVLGEQTIVVTSSTASDGRSSVTSSERGRALFTPDEIRRLPADQQIVLMQGQPGLVAQKLCYFEDDEFDGLFDENPLLR